MAYEFTRASSQRMTVMGMQSTVSAYAFSCHVNLTTSPGISYPNYFVLFQIGSDNQATILVTLEGDKVGMTFTISNSNYRSYVSSSIGFSIGQ